MSRTRLLFLLTFSLLVASSYAQKINATLVLKDGKVLKGYGKLTNSNVIKFRATKKGKKQFYSFEEQVDTLKLFTEQNPIIYVRMKVKDKTELLVLEVAKVGKNVFLYTSTSQGYSGATGIGTGGLGSPVAVGNFYSISNSYVRKANEDEVYHLGSDRLFSKNFKKAASDYFKDCPALVEKIQAREFKKKDLEEIIDFYNEKCNIVN